MAELWQKSLARLQQQFEALTTANKSLSCLLQEINRPASEDLSLFQPRELYGRQLAGTDIGSSHRYPSFHRVDGDAGSIRQFAFYGDVSTMNDFRLIAESAGAFVWSNSEVRSVCPRLPNTFPITPNYTILWFSIVFDLAASATPGSPLRAEPYIGDTLNGMEIRASLRQIDNVRRMQWNGAAFGKKDAFRQWHEKVAAPDPPHFIYMDLTNIISGSTEAIDILLERANSVNQRPLPPREDSQKSDQAPKTNGSSSSESDIEPFVPTPIQKAILGTGAV
jgi:hypothetical protein